MASEGWRCPTCGSVYAPWVAKCYVCPVGSSVAGDTQIYYAPDHMCEMDPDGELLLEIPSTTPDSDTDPAGPEETR